MGYRRHRHPSRLSSPHLSPLCADRMIQNCAGSKWRNDWSQLDVPGLPASVCPRIRTGRTAMISGTKPFPSSATAAPDDSGNLPPATYNKPKTLPRYGIFSSFPHQISRHLPSGTSLWKGAVKIKFPCDIRKFGHPISARGVAVWAAACSTTQSGTRASLVFHPS